MSDKSNTSELSTIEHVFGLLDAWRHLPAYQLERRADVFFALFLPDVLEAGFSVEINRRLIPEFPIKKGGNNQSKNVDYFALSQDRERAFLVELKTDMESIDRKREQERIRLLKSKTATQIIDDLKLIAKSKSVRSNKHTRGKYFHLFLELKELGLIDVPRKSDLENLIPPRSMRKARYDECIDEITVSEYPSVEVVYVVPVDGEPLCGVEQINFDYFADHVEKRDVIGGRFSTSLRKWKKQAGSLPSAL